MFLAAINGCTEVPNVPICGNGIIEEGETKENCCMDVGCHEGFICKNNICTELEKPITPVCGNGIIEEGETSENCCIDVGCPEGQSCKDNVCVVLEKDKIKYGTISGRVTPAKAGIRVKAIQNLSFIAETTTNSDGSYKIINLTEGRYGLLFVMEEQGYIYNDEINSEWFDEKGSIKPNENIVVTNQDSSKYNIDLNNEQSDYAADMIAIDFKQNVSTEERESIIHYYNCSIIKVGDVLGAYRLKIPTDKTVLEMVNIFKSNPKIEDATPLFKTATASIN